MLIYLITNTVNNKKYVGQTIKTLHERFSRHCSFSNCESMAISRAIKKYGKDKFCIEKLQNCETLEELNLQEVWWIQNLNTLSPNGYNVSFGGGNKIMADEIKQKISKKLTGRIKRYFIFQIKIG